MSMSVSIYLAERPQAFIQTYGGSYWVALRPDPESVREPIAIHCRSEAQAILIADAINLPDAEAAPRHDPAGLPDREIASGIATTAAEIAAEDR